MLNENVICVCMCIVCVHIMWRPEVNVRCLLYILDMFFVSLRQGLLLNSEFTGLARLVS